MAEIARLTLDGVDADAAEPTVKALLDGTRKSLGFVPNMYTNMANSSGLLDTYMVGYKHFRAESHLAPAEQEVVLLTISHENRCQYCMAAHSMVGEKMSNVPAAVLSALRAGNILPDARLQALSVFTRLMVKGRGNPSPGELQVFLAAGFSERHVLEIILAIAVKTISNYANHLFHTELDAVFSGYRWDA
ncbi:putative peroxidase-related enzyme [Ciceribacter lividus]|uniref:Putative peroxidase-related enzyme n=1 Tax=Ciceribacter lividus TaxID=1197950 RepID=A0A6I7HMZ6_9HYPH|nr:carboxymuconolactone decarboxylase family protein [Ciceribacter lividus]RCW24082.1 putative peroxidase-related enzyme [Ciceribacter lividus]